MELKMLTFQELYEKYAERHVAHPDKLWDQFSQQVLMFDPEGWFLGESLEISTSPRYSLLCFGKNNTYTEIPTEMYSEGLSMQFKAVAWMPVAALPKDRPVLHLYTSDVVAKHLGVKMKRLMFLVSRDKLIARSGEEPRFTGVDVNRFCEDRGLPQRLTEQ